MKNIFIVRHAKSTKDIQELIDFERPLNERGVKNANQISEDLLKKKEIPEVIITSPAIRAISTALIFANKFDFPWEKFLVKDGIYEADAETILNVIRHIPDEYQSAMIFGHNPGFTILCNKLGNKPIDNMPTSAVMKIELNISSWKEAGNEKGNVALFETPKALSTKEE